jgi:hypothetical protein
MEEHVRRTTAQQINTWVQTVALSFATLWGACTWYYAQVIVPRSAPINITVDLDLKKVGQSGIMASISNDALLPIEMRLVAKNPSSRPVFLLPSHWVAWGRITVAARERDPFKLGTSITSTSDTWTLQRHARVSDSVVVAYGRLLKDEVLKPNEILTRTVIFYVPPNKYNSILVRSDIPSDNREGAVDLEWRPDEKTDDLNVTMYRIGQHGERVKMERDKDGGYSDPQLELQAAFSEAEVSL